MTRFPCLKKHSKRYLSLLSHSILSFAFAGALIVGCSERPETTAPALNSSDGISSIINDANIETDKQVTDPRLNALFSDASPAISISDSYYDVFSIRITWGNLTDTTNVNNTSTNWNGGVFVNAVGALVVRSTIDFEHGQDSLIPRDSRTAVGWVSQTSGDRDGVLLELYLRKDVDYLVEPWLTFKTEPLTVEFKIHQLANLDTVIHAGDGNIVAFRAHHVSGDGCPKGYLAGIWKHKSHEGGGFRGKWIAIDGLVMGHLAGEFKRTNDHGGVFAGKWWDTENNWQGHLRGKWEYSDSPTDCADCPDKIGRFVGHFTDTQGNIRGEIAGRFGHPDDAEAVDHENHFWGKWWVHCAGTGGQ